MITTDTRNELGITVAKDLRSVMQGKAAIAGEASCEGAQQVFSGAVDRRPTPFAFCENARDVQEAVRAARAYGLPLSVRGGGHDRLVAENGRIKLLRESLNPVAVAQALLPGSVKDLPDPEKVIFSVPLDYRS